MVPVTSPSGPPSWGAWTRALSVPGGDGEVPAGDGEGGEAAGAAAAGSGPAGEPSAQPAETEFGAGSDNLAQDGSGVGGP